jgi:signal-transduction protein with cAMP-binding, CBS, and nucleotidyltransferase domain
MVLALLWTRDLVGPGRKRQGKVDKKKCASSTDLDLLNRLKHLSCLSADALRELASGLDSANFQRREVILAEEALATGVHILLKGVAKITCVNRCGQRVTVALLAPGPIPEFPSLAVSRWHFRCEAYTDCRFGNLDWDRFDIITRAVPQSALRKFHENNLMQWYP